MRVPLNGEGNTGIRCSLKPKYFCGEKDTSCKPSQSKLLLSLRLTDCYVITQLTIHHADHPIYQLCWVSCTVQYTTHNMLYHSNTWIRYTALILTFSASFRPCSNNTGTPQQLLNLVLYFFQFFFYSLFCSMCQDMKGSHSHSAP